MLKTKTNGFNIRGIIGTSSILAGCGSGEMLRLVVVKEKNQ